MRIQNQIDLRFSIAYIENGKKHGTAFLLSSDGYFLTCNHVVEDTNKIDFFLPNEKGEFKIHCEVTKIDSWEEREGDFCLLKIISDLPNNLNPINFYSSEYGLDDEIKTFGFPESKKVNGQHGIGKVIDNTLRSDTEISFPIIQIEESNSITCGFSGAPIFSKKLNGIIGIINSGVINLKENRQTGTTFGIPIEYIFEKINRYITIKLEIPENYLVNTTIQPQLIEIIKQTNLHYDQKFLMTELEGVYKARQGWLDKKLFFEKKLSVAFDTSQQYNLLIQVKEIEERIEDYTNQITRLLTQIQR